MNTQLIMNEQSVKNRVAYMLFRNGILPISASLICRFVYSCHNPTLRSPVTLYIYICRLQRTQLRTYDTNVVNDLKLLFMEIIMYISILIYVYLFTYIYLIYVSVYFFAQCRARMSTLVHQRRVSSTFFQFFLFNARKKSMFSFLLISIRHGVFYVFHLFFRVYLENDYLNVYFKFYDIMWTSEWTFDSSLILSFENLYIFYYLILIYLLKLIIKIIFERVEIMFRNGIIIAESFEYRI